MRKWFTVASLLVLPLLQVGVMQAGSSSGKPTAVASQNAGLAGSTLSWQYYFNGGTYGRLHSFVVEGGPGGVIGGVFHAGSTVYFGLLANDTSITFDYANATSSGTWSSSILSLAPTVYNGLAVNLVSGTPFVTVTINPATNMVGFDASRVSFTSNQIQVDWQNLSWTKSTIVRLDINAGLAGPQ